MHGMKEGKDAERQKHKKVGSFHFPECVKGMCPLAKIEFAAAGM